MHGADTFTQELADRICAELAEGKSLREVCRGEGMPTQRTVLDWTEHKDRQEFAAQYTQARARGFELMAEELVEISDDAMQDPNRSRLMLDTRKWMLSKMLPKVYGDKVQHEVKGSVNIIASKHDEML